jgi:hypothetical protein
VKVHKYFLHVMADVAMLTPTLLMLAFPVPEDKRSIRRQTK